MAAADEPNPPDAALLARGARYFSQRPQFLGYWLERYRDLEGLERPALARALGCRPETLDALAICLCPRRERLAEDTAHLAARFGIDADALAAVLLQTTAQERARARPPAAVPALVHEPRSVFAAARDREEEPAPEPQPQEEEERGP